MKTRSRTVLIIIIIATLVMSSGCWSRREMDTIAFILVLGIDTTPQGKVKLVAQIGLPSAEPAGGEGPVIQVITSEGDDVTQAMDNLALTITKRPSLNHLRFLVFSEDIARDGVGKVIDYLRRDIGVRLNIRTAVTTSDLEELLELEEPLSIQPALALDNQFSLGLQRSSVVRSQLMDFIRQLLEPDRQALLPIVDVNEDLFILDSTAIFRDYQMAAILNREQTLGLLMWRNQVNMGVFTVIHGESEEAVSFRIVSSSTRIDTRWDGERLHVQAVVDTVVDIAEKQVELRIYEELASNYMRNRMQGVLKVAKEEGIDFLNLAVHLRRQDPEAWAEIEGRWTEILRDAEYDLQSRADIRGQGQNR